MSVSIRLEYSDKPLQNSETRRMQIGRFLMRNGNVVRKVVTGAAVAAGVAVATSGVIGMPAAVGLGVGAAALETAGGQARKALRVIAGIGVVAAAAAFGGAGVERTVRTVTVLAGTVGGLSALAFGAIDQADNPGIIGSIKIVIVSAATAAVVATSTALGTLAGPKIAAASAGIFAGNFLGNSVGSIAKYLIDDDPLD